jgi:hypothetical protein
MAISPASLLNRALLQKISMPVKLVEILADNFFWRHDN